MGILDSQATIDAYLDQLFPEVPVHSDSEPESKDLIDQYIEKWLEENLERVVTEIFEKRLLEKTSEQRLQSTRLGVMLNQLTGKDYYDTQG